MSVLAASSTVACNDSQCRRLCFCVYVRVLSGMAHSSLDHNDTRMISEVLIKNRC